MEFRELTLVLPAEHLETAAAIALMIAPGGMYLEDYRDLEADAQAIAHSDLIDEALLAQDRAVGKIHIYLPPQEPPAEAVAFLRERLTALGIPCQTETRDVRSEDWENCWKAYFHPVPVGERLLIQPAWEAPTPEKYPGRAVLLMEPGVAFGSGAHATTRLCLEALEAAIAAAPAPPAVADIGCGSGILAVAALLLGAKQALGVDIDPLAVQSATENGLRNGFAPPVLEIRTGSLAEQLVGQYDVIVSNIVADAIIALAAQAERRLAPGGVWISSGIIDTRAAEICAALQAQGWHIAERREESGWVCLAATRCPCEDDL